MQIELKANKRSREVTLRMNADAAVVLLATAGKMFGEIADGGEGFLHQIYAIHAETVGDTIRELLQAFPDLKEGPK